MIAITPMIARVSLQMPLTLGIRRSLSIARTLPGWTTGESVPFLDKPDDAGNLQSARRSPRRAEANILNLDRRQCVSTFVLAPSGPPVVLSACELKPLEQPEGQHEFERPAGDQPNQPDTVDHVNKIHLLTKAVVCTCHHRL